MLHVHVWPVRCASHFQYKSFLLIVSIAGVPESVCQVAALKSEELESSDTHLQERKQEERARVLLNFLSHQSDVTDNQIISAARKAIVA